MNATHLRFFGLLGAFAAGLALARDRAPLPELKAPPPVISPLPFDHAAHGRTFRGLGVGCLDCHPVGLATGEVASSSPPVNAVKPPLGSCHGCHLETWDGAARRAPATCETCHEGRAALRPTDHAGMWATEHALPALDRHAGCESCHDRAQCVDCHDRRGALTRSPHPPAFERLHGVDARLDPQSCSSCHAVSVCQDCHAEGKRSW